MDLYTSDVKKWLDERYRYCDEEGVFIAHQPIYGFRRGHCEADCLSRYVITYSALKALSRLPYKTFLDVGGAEGYKAWMVRGLLGMTVRSSDLSGEACKRSREIFGVDSDEVDAQRLPYEDGEFDIVLSSESIEHVEDFRASVDELVRVARRAVVITVPHDDPEYVRRNIEEKVLHGHIHAFNTASFDYLKERGLRVMPFKILHPLTAFMGPFVDAVAKGEGKRRQRLSYRAFNFLLPLFRRLIGIGTASRIMEMDRLLCRILGGHRGLVFVVLKPEAELRESGASVKAGDVLKASVPLYRLREDPPAPV